MGAIRELIAKFTLLFDDRGSRKANATLQNLERQATMLSTAMGQVFAATAVAAPFAGLIKMASDAQETLNVLSVAFGDNADDVEAWAQKYGAAVGRSRYTLQKLAGQMGALVRPMVQDTDKAAEMSKRLTEMAVDISSVWNISEDVAMGRMLSGMSGETEAIKRLGILMTQTNLEAFALEKGMGKTAKSMTAAELATLRYQYIMEKGAFMLGDAERTQWMLANSARALRDQFRDLGTDIGFFLLPAAEELVKWLRGIIGPLDKVAIAFKEWHVDTGLAMGMLIALGSVIGLLLLPLLVKLVGLALAFGILALVFEEVYVTLKGGHSLLGLFNKALDDLVENIESLDAADMSGWDKLFATMVTTLDDILELIGGVMLALVQLATGDIEGAKLTGDTLWTRLKESAENTLGYYRTLPQEFMNLNRDIVHAISSSDWARALEWALVRGPVEAVKKLPGIVSKAMGAVSKAAIAKLTELRDWQTSFLVEAAAWWEGWADKGVEAYYRLLDDLKQFGRDVLAWARDLKKQVLEAFSWDIAGKLDRSLGRAREFLGIASNEGGVQGGSTVNLGRTLPPPAALSGSNNMSIDNRPTLNMSVEIVAPAGTDEEVLASMVEDKIGEGISKMTEDLMMSIPTAEGSY